MESVVVQSDAERKKKALHSFISRKAYGSRGGMRENARYNPSQQRTFTFLANNSFQRLLSPSPAKYVYAHEMNIFFCCFPYSSSIEHILLQTLSFYGMMHCQNWSKTTKRKCRQTRTLFSCSYRLYKNENIGNLHHWASAVSVRPTCLQSGLDNVQRICYCRSYPSGTCACEKMSYIFLRKIPAPGQQRTTL